MFLVDSLEFNELVRLAAAVTLAPNARGILSIFNNNKKRLMVLEKLVLEIDPKKSHNILDFENASISSLPRLNFRILSLSRARFVFFYQR